MSQNPVTVALVLITAYATLVTALHQARARRAGPDPGSGPRD